MQEAAFLEAIRANPEDDKVRLVYSDWLEEQGDDRADFLRLHLALKSLSSDHLHRVSGEHELSFLRKSLDGDWLAVVEPEHAHSGKDLLGRHAALCCCGLDRLKGPSRDEKCREIDFHVETQDTECDAWKRLLDLVEDAAADRRTTFDPRDGLEETGLCQIVTLPSTIEKLKSVEKLYLYGSSLVRIPPEIAEMTSLKDFDPYTSYQLHWLPYEITRCPNLTKSRLSTRALYGNFKHRPPFPRLDANPVTVGGRVEPAELALKHWKTASTRNCSVCNQPFIDFRLHRVWISRRVATDVLPLLVNACSEECIRQLPNPPDNYVSHPHKGGAEVVQPDPYHISRLRG